MLVDGLQQAKQLLYTRSHQSDLHDDDIRLERYQVAIYDEGHLFETELPACMPVAINHSPDEVFSRMSW